MRMRFLLPVLFLFVIPIAGQVEHAPTPEQCKADADSWGIPTWALLVQHENEFAILAGVVKNDRAVSAKMIEARSREFTQCVKTDNKQSDRYAQAARAYAIGELARMGDFMQRHNLTTQFYDEDEQGKR